MNGRHETGFRREVVASFSSFLEAERAVDHLVEQRLPTQRVSIVGQDLRPVPGELRAGRVARLFEAGLTGATVGGLVILAAALLDLVADLTYGGALAAGALCGLLGALAAEMTAVGGRIPDSEIRFFADRYDVVVDERIAEKAASAIDGQAAGSD